MATIFRATTTARKLLQETILPLCQYFAYRGSRLIPTYIRLARRMKPKLSVAGLHRGSIRENVFQMRRVARRDHIYPVFRRFSSGAAASVGEVSR